MPFLPFFSFFLHFYSLFNSQCSLIWQQCHFSFPPPTVLSCCPDCGSQYLSISQSRYNSVCNFGEFLLKMFKGINGIKAKVIFLSFFFPFFRNISHIKFVSIVQNFIKVEFVLNPIIVSYHYFYWIKLDSIWSHH